MVAAAALLVAAVGAAAVTRLVGEPERSGSADRATGSATRLGPRDGEQVADYLADARATVARLPDRHAGYALVAFDRYLAPGRVPAVLDPVPMVRVLVRVPLPRVQTEIITAPARTSADVVGGMGAAAARLDRSATTADPVSAAVDRAQADRLRAACRCVLGAVVRAGRADLARLAGRPDVRAVEAAPPGEPLARLAFDPLLPEQRVRVEPPPDDGAAALVRQYGASR